MLLTKTDIPLTIIQDEVTVLRYLTKLNINLNSATKVVGN